MALMVSTEKQSNKALTIPSRDTADHIQEYRWLWPLGLAFVHYLYKHHCLSDSDGVYFNECGDSELFLQSFWVENGGNQGDVTLVLLHIVI